MVAFFKIHVFVKPMIFIQSSTYAAMRDGMYCSCGVSAYGEEDSGAVCDVLCDGDNTTTCGGQNHYAVYTTKMSKTFLYISYPGTTEYIL